jgi:hypothetical protein
MSLIVYFATIAAIAMANKHGPGRAFLAVYMPVLLLIPDTYKAITPGLPDPTFSQAAILPILFVTLARYGSRWRPAPMDLLIFLFAGWVAYSDYIARGYADAQNLMFSMMASVVAPYIVARLVIPAERLHVDVARRYVILLFASAVIGVWEFRFGFNPFIAAFERFFPGQSGGWVTTFRYGVARVAGPFSHAILAGIMMVLAYRLNRWLEWGGHWEPKFKRVALPWPKARVITVVLFVAMIMTVARGPWIGGIIGAGIAMVGRARNRKKALRISLALLAVGSLVGGKMLASYLDIQPGAHMTMSQESAFYRKVLMEKYFDIALDHMWFGWGLTTWPKVGGMESIDNYYLLLSLMHGVPATLMLVFMLLGSSVMCIRKGLNAPEAVAMPLFALAGIFVAIFVSLGTVYLGEQVLPTMFLMMGWAQGLMRDGGIEDVHPSATPAQARPAFRHVIR